MLWSRNTHAATSFGFPSNLRLRSAMARSLAISPSTLSTRFGEPTTSTGFPISSHFGVFQRNSTGHLTASLGSSTAVVRATQCLLTANPSSPRYSARSFVGPDRRGDLACPLFRRMRKPLRSRPGSCMCSLKTPDEASPSRLLEIRPDVPSLPMQSLSQQALCPPAWRFRLRATMAAAHPQLPSRAWPLDNYLVGTLQL